MFREKRQLNVCHVRIIVLSVDILSNGGCKFSSIEFKMYSIGLRSAFVSAVTCKSFSLIAAIKFRALSTFYHTLFLLLDSSRLNI